MRIVIKEGDSKSSIEKKMRKLVTGKKKGFPAFQFLGKVKIDEDPLLIQKRLRDEWAERSR